MAAPGGQAKIAYPNGCVVPVGPGGVATVGECKEPMTAGLEPGRRSVAAPIPWVPFVLGAGVIAVGVCAIACFHEEEHGHKKHSRKRTFTVRFAARYNILTAGLTSPARCALCASP